MWKAILILGTLSIGALAAFACDCPDLFENAIILSLCEGVGIFLYVLIK